MKTLLNSKQFRKGKTIKTYNITQCTTNYKPCASFNKQRDLSSGSTRINKKSLHWIKANNHQNWLKSTSFQNKNGLTKHWANAIKTRQDHEKHKQYTFSYDDNEFRFSWKKTMCEPHYLLTDNTNADKNSILKKGNINTTYNNNNNQKDNQGGYHGRLSKNTCQSKSGNNNKRSTKQTKYIYAYMTNTQKSVHNIDNKVIRETKRDNGSIDNARNNSQNNKQWISNTKSDNHNWKNNVWHPRSLSAGKDIIDITLRTVSHKGVDTKRSNNNYITNANANTNSNSNISKSSLLLPSSSTGDFKKDKDHWIGPNIKYIYKLNKAKYTSLSHNASDHWQSKNDNKYHSPTQMSTSSLWKASCNFSQTHYFESDQKPKNRNINIRTIKKYSVPSITSITSHTSHTNLTTNYNYNTWSSRIKSSTISSLTNHPSSSVRDNNIKTKASTKYPLVSSVHRNIYKTSIKNIMTPDTKKIVMQIVDKLVWEKRKHNPESVMKPVTGIIPEKSSENNNMNNKCCVITLKVLSNWGHKYHVGIRDIQWFDHKNRIIPIVEWCCFERNKNDVGKVFYNTRKWNDNEFWTTLFTKGIKLELYTARDTNTPEERKEVKLIKIWNHNGKDLKKGIKEMEVWKNNKLEWKGIIGKGAYNSKQNYSSKIHWKEYEKDSDAGNMTDRHMNKYTKKCNDEYSFEGKKNGRDNELIHTILHKPSNSSSSQFVKTELRMDMIKNKNPEKMNEDNLSSRNNEINNVDNEGRGDINEDVNGEWGGDMGEEGNDWTMGKARNTSTNNNNNNNCSARRWMAFEVPTFRNTFNDINHNNLCWIHNNNNNNDKDSKSNVLLIDHRLSTSYISFKNLKLTLLSNYGHKAFIGLSGICWYDKNGEPIPIETAESVGAFPKDLHTELNDVSDRRVFENIFNKVNHTTDENQMWLTVFGPRPSIEIEFREFMTLSYIDIWNYNAPSGFNKCAKEIRISADNDKHWTVLLHKGSGIDNCGSYNQRIYLPGINNKINQSIDIENIMRLIRSCNQNDDGDSAKTGENEQK